jgi:hypothetical protein
MMVPWDGDTINIKQKKKRKQQQPGQNGGQPDNNNRKYTKLPAMRTGQDGKQVYVKIDSTTPKEPPVAEL